MFKYIAALFLFLNTTLLWAAQRHILVLHSYDMSYAWTQKLQEGITEAFTELPNDFDVHVEYMDSRRYRTNEYDDEVSVWFKKKYKDIKFFAVLTADDDAFNFFIRYSPTLFQNIPLFFCGKGIFDESILKTHKAPIRGVMEYMDMVSNLKMASRLHGTNKAYFISDASTTGIVQEAKWKKEFSNYAPEIDVTYLSMKDFSHGELLDHIRQLDSGFIVLNVIGQDKNGVIVDNLRSTDRITEVSKIPVYAESSIRLGHGVIGGKVKDGVIHGKSIAAKLVKYARGVDLLPYIDPVDENLIIFDYKILEKFHISLSDLPAGAIVINRPVGAYAEYKYWIWGFVLLIFIMVLIIGFQSYRMNTRKIFPSATPHLSC